MNASEDETAEPTRSGFAAAVGGLVLIVAIGFALSFYMRVARGIWRIIVGLFPEFSTVVTVALGVIGVFGAIGIGVAGISAAARLGWIHAGRLTDQNALTSKNTRTSGLNSTETDIQPYDAVDSLSHRLAYAESLPVGAALVAAKELINRWYVIGPEDRAAAVDLLALAAEDEDVVPF